MESQSWSEKQALERARGGGEIERGMERRWDRGKEGERK